MKAPSSAGILILEIFIATILTIFPMSLEHLYDVRPAVLMKDSRHNLW